MHILVRLALSLALTTSCLVLISEAKKHNEPVIDSEIKPTGFVAKAVNGIQKGNGKPSKVCHNVTLNELQEVKKKPCAKCCYFFKWEAYYYDSANKCACLPNDSKTHFMAVKNQLDTPEVDESYKLKFPRSSFTMADDYVP